jgi:hypothetical protein
MKASRLTKESEEEDVSDFGNEETALTQSQQRK